MFRLLNSLRNLKEKKLIMTESSLMENDNFLNMFLFRDFNSREVNAVLISSISYMRVKTRRGKPLETKQNCGILWFPWKLEEEVGKKSMLQSRMESLLRISYL